MLTASQVREQFWADNPHLSRKKIRCHNGRGWMYVTDTRVAFVDYVDSLHRDGVISDKVANSVNLGGG